MCVGDCHKADKIETSKTSTDGEYMHCNENAIFGAYTSIFKTQHYNKINYRRETARRSIYLECR